MHDAARTQFDDAALARLLPGVTPPERIRLKADSFADDVDPITRFAAEDFNLYLHDDVLTKVDRMSMANSLEVRVPFLDHTLVELAFSMPINCKLQKSLGSGAIRSKHLLKRSAARFFSDDLLDRPKWGFGVPMLAWCTGPLAPLLRARLADRSNPVFGLIDFQTVQEIVQPLIAGKAGDSAAAWTVLMLDLWLERVHGASTHDAS
jgi:asparagine synthase (glutamine-hydrolysing)